MTMRAKLDAWNRHSDALDYERNRLATLHGPVPKNPDHLTKLTKIRVIIPFMAHAVRQEVGAIVTLPAADAHESVALGRAVLIEE